MTDIKQPVTDVTAYHEQDHKLIQRTLTVEQIMTPRRDFLCCSASERVVDAFAGIPDVYDAAPVVDGARDDPDADIIGLLWRSDEKRAKALETVSSYTDERAIESPLPRSESILQFARTASADRIVFVEGEKGILGLVTVFDLERLPVRLSLFQHVLYFEQRLGETIIALAPNEETWADLAPSKRKTIEQGIDRSRHRDHEGSPILGIGFSEKLEIAKNLLSEALGKAFDPKLLHRVAIFRNEIAHGLPFGRVEDVPLRICQIDTLLGNLSSIRTRRNG
jgi:hypothetical protein